jgi:hypothetical protein
LRAWRDYVDFTTFVVRGDDTFGHAFREEEPRFRGRGAVAHDLLILGRCVKRLGRFSRGKLHDNQSFPELRALDRLDRAATNEKTPTVFFDQPRRLRRVLLVSVRIVDADGADQIGAHRL